DEILLPEGAPFLRAIVASESRRIGFNLRCINEVDEHHGGGETSHLVLRLFPNHPELRFVQPLHEYIFDPASPLPGGVIRGATIDVTIRHRGYLKSVVVGRKKRERNLAIAKMAVERHPDDAFHWYGLGQTYGFASQRQEAKQPLERMRELAGPDDKRGIIVHGIALLAEIYALEGDALLAEERARDALRRSPGYPNALFALAMALKRQGRVEEAIAAYRDASAQEINTAKYAVVDDQICAWKASCDLGVYLSELERFDEALAELRLAISRAPDVMTVRINYAHALERAARFEEAEQAFIETFERHPVAQSTLQHANFLLRRLRRDDALRFLETAAPRMTTERERNALIEARTQLFALNAADAVQRLSAEIAGALPGIPAEAATQPSPEEATRRDIVAALQENRWGDAADLLLRLAVPGAEEDRMRLLCAFRLGE
ncbi:MAG: hypothetical protein KGM44_12130, partial [bacterium]|nr:hypothetical protein [bacterium]